MQHWRRARGDGGGDGGAAPVMAGGGDPAAADTARTEQFRTEAATKGPKLRRPGDAPVRYGKRT